VLHQVGVSFDLYYDARKHKIKKLLYMNLETTRLRGTPRNRQQDEMRNDGRLTGGKGRKERVYSREEWKKLLRTARNRRFCTY